ncbi:orotate phosphoribosyltransferase [Thalassoporum mexicanum PCC 7367]|uniref:orotidine-5'-phosphate decarboxylase n=1 Tax=Thalassoporum mexicanum TaxID=3457544 RepID=UPI00029FD0E9|nr:orotidine-5'-phosphate decarboxylase [Pseudanabaena sp. PCC 7367]AFY71039.1 orotate phosphoribosyltransferase [Pseudanabaena sp. PCC 7367]
MPQDFVPELPIESSFLAKLDAAIATNDSLLCIGLEPNPETIPAEYAAEYIKELDRHSDPDQVAQMLWQWLQYVIRETSAAVCAYKPTLGFYTALGSVGMELLSQTLAIIPDHIPVILDAKHGDINSSSVLAHTAFSRWHVDAITLSPWAGQDSAARFLNYANKAVFVQCHSANLTAQALQNYPDPNSPVYLELVRQCQTWGTDEQLGFEVGAAQPDAIARVRAIAPERLILARSLWAQSDEQSQGESGDPGKFSDLKLAQGSRRNEAIDQPDNLTQLLEAGLDQNGKGLILTVRQDILTTNSPARQMRSLCDLVNQIRIPIAAEQPICPIWLPNVCVIDAPSRSPLPHFDLILQLYDIGCIMFGEYVQASGETFPYYVDLRKIISNPQVFDKVIAAYAGILQELNFDRIAGIPYGALPTATGLALQLNRPMIFPRKEVKAYGARRLIEGHFEPGERIVVVDDIMISGKSVIEGVKKLESSGLVVKDIVVFINHERGVSERIADQGYRSHAVLTISEIATTLYQAGRLSEDQVSFFAHH